MQADSPLVTYVYEASTYGGSHNPNIVCIHDVEAPLDNGFARSLTGPNWFGGPAPTSAHYVVGPDDICQGVPENRVAWHCGTGNPRSIAIEQCGYARYSRAEWDTPKGLVQQENVAKLLADINRRRPLVRLRWLSNAELRAAWNNPGSPGGIATHDQMRATFGGTTHHDPFNAAGQTVAYPLQQVIDRSVAIRDGHPKPPQDWFDMASKEDLQALLSPIVDRLAALEANVNKIGGRTVQHIPMVDGAETGAMYGVVSRLQRIEENVNRVDARTAQNIPMVDGAEKVLPQGLMGILTAPKA